MPAATVIDLDAENDDDDQYEYEYSSTETETFYVHLDLSSVNGVLKSATASDRRSLRAPAASKSKKGKEKAQEQDVNGDEQNQDEDEAREDGDENDTPRHDGSPKNDEPDTRNDSIQILELHSDNPIISYRNQIYSCEWTDMIGTNMFFTKHNDVPVHEPEIATEDYDLLGTSRIKLVGHKANLTAKSQSRREEQQHDNNGGQAAGPSTMADRGTAAVDQADNAEADEDGEDGHTAVSNEVSTVAASNHSKLTHIHGGSQTQKHAKRQAAFLDKLREIKRARGEQDKILTIVDRHAEEVAAEKQKEEAAKMRNEIDQLNARVVRGDTKALERLQEIYSNIEEAESEEDEAAK